MNQSGAYLLLKHAYLTLEDHYGTSLMLNRKEIFVVPVLMLTDHSQDLFGQLKGVVVVVEVGVGDLMA